MRGATFWKRLRKNLDSNFYSHAPCGARRGKLLTLQALEKFLLTRPMRGATFTVMRSPYFRVISTHTPHAGRDLILTSCAQTNHISTHTPHAGRDGVCFGVNASSTDFYSHAPCGARLPKSRIHGGDAGFLLTRPMRGATEGNFHTYEWKYISTHTPHAGRDYDGYTEFYRTEISTHTPHAGRDLVKECNNG